MQAISTKYLGPTNYRGSRIKATCEAGSLTVGYDHAKSGADVHAVAAVALARRLGWAGTLISGGTQTGYVFVFEASDRHDVGLTREEADAIQRERFEVLREQREEHASA